MKVKVSGSYIRQKELLPEIILGHNLNLQIEAFLKTNDTSETRIFANLKSSKSWHLLNSFVILVLH